MNKIIDYVNSNFDIHVVYYEIFNKHIPTGKMFCPCPTHNNVNTPAAKCYNNVIHCFSCNKTYSVYNLLKWYKPEKLEQIKSSIILEQGETHKPKVYPKVLIDRKLGLENALKTIIAAMET